MFVKRGLFLMIVGIMITDCAYYNTFYNAKKAFNQAEDLRRDALKNGDTSLTQQMIQLYDKAIETSARVLRDFPDSDLIDDALVLIGDAFVAKEEYPKAVRKYEEVLSNYPDSKWAPYCAFALGKAALAAGDTGRAETALQDFLQEHPKNKWAPDAHLFLGDIALERQEYNAAVTRYTELLHQFPKHKRRHEAQYRIAEAYMRLDRYPEALALFQQVARSADTRDLEFQAHYMVGECLRGDRQYEAAAQTFERLIKKSAYIAHRPKIILALASCQYALDRIDQAYENYRDITETYADNRAYDKEVAQAYYQMGLIAEHRGNLTEAESFYSDAQRRSPQKFWVNQQAATKSNDLHQLQKFQEQLAAALAEWSPPDTTAAEMDTSMQYIQTEGVETDGASAPDPRVIERVVKARMQLAELYLFRFELPDSALVQYRLVKHQARDRETAAKAAYGEAWVLGQVVKDTVASRQAYQRLLDEFGDTVYASTARRALSLPDTSGPSAAELFRKAETLLFTAHNPDSAAVCYRRIVSQFPEGEFAPRALYAIGWIAETYRHDIEAALKAYHELAETYPNTEPGRMAAFKIQAINELDAVAAGTDTAVTARETPDAKTGEPSGRADMSRMLEASPVPADTITTASPPAPVEKTQASESRP